MGASAYVGRVGGLAVALGIGAAVFLGQGVASADTSGTSGSAGSSDSSPGSSQSSTKSSTAGTSGSVAKQDSSADDKQSTSKTTKTTKTAVDSSKSTTTKHESKKKPDPSAQSGKTEQDSTPKTAATDAKPERSTSTATAHETTDTDSAATKDSAPTASVAVAQTTSVTEATVATPKPQPSAPADTVTAAISQAVSALLSPLAGDSPTAPVESPVSWIALAATRKQIGTAPGVAKVADPVATSAVVGPTPAATVATTANVTANVTATVAIAPPTNVVAIPQVSLVTALGLQRVPIIGQLFVTPIVAFVNSIPIFSDLLHPIFGYPLQAGLPAGSPQPEDVKVISFDGTQINVHFMPAAGLLAGQQAPTILEGPGLGMPGATNLNGTPLDGIIEDNLGQIGIATLRDAGYNVVTWDPRGEYFSGGVLELDSPDYEARDVSSIISWVAQQPEAKLDGPNDPRLGMVGVSYGGGIQLVTAAIDHRIDAIVPTIAWNTLNDALYPNQDFKTGWGTLLTAALLATFARPNPAVYPAAIQGDLTTMLTQAQQALLAARGPGGTLDLIGQITAPTLLFQGTVDTLFPLAEADMNATELIADGVPTKVVWFCGGHGVCTNNVFDPTDGVVIKQDTLAWLAHYVMGETAVSTGPQFQWVDQHGQYYSSNVYPVPTGTPIVTTSTTTSTLPIVPLLGGSGPLLGVLPIGGTKAFNAINLTVPAATTTTYVVGAPQLTLTYSGTGISRFVYAQLVDDATGEVLGNQVTPIPVTLNGKTQTITTPLNMIAATLQPGQTVTLQLVASSADFATIRALGALTVSSMTLSLPTADPSAVATTSVV
jgi:ABC-2 type transport system ATP-binding protein